MVHTEMTPRIVVLALVAVMAVGCTPASPNAAPTMSPGDSPSASPSETAQPTPSPVVENEPTVVAGDLVLRVDTINPETGPAYPIPLLSVYEDGSVIHVVDDPATNYGRAEYARLTASGLETVLAEAGGASILETGNPVGDRLADLNTWLAAGAWELPPDARVTWIPAGYMLAMRVYEESRAWPVDIDDIWPLAGDVATFGEPIAGDQPAPGDPQARCGVVTLDEALELQTGLRDPTRIGIPRDIATWMEFSWDREAAWVALVLEALMPDEPRTCESIRFYP